ncbi:adenine-specific methyltransferase EcoRI family protein [uncultured Treponema sp.]|uniref:adenine-specific methyltransferase EcoRI family protein n=1 Tax=uncultured Treponema sp. TaxID=162155 RepID=UPI0025D22906|nr:adenine-specific methyltransferase EcoRI family protein [uncultured Treponema sp.]
MKNGNLHSAKENKEDEFYTELTEIEKELVNYKEHFKNKTILCNCDDPRASNFFKYFALNFNYFGLKKLISVCYKNQDFDLFSQNDCEKAVYVEYTGSKSDHIPTNDELELKELKGDGDFRSAECIELLKQADIVVTNPPFSLFREYVAQLMKYEKKFIIIGSQNAITYKEIFPLIADNKMWLGYKTGDMAFRVPDYYEPRATRFWIDENGQKWRSLGNICWYTNLDITKRHEDLILYETYTPEKYPKYDNYDAIEVSKVSEIPNDYLGWMGVPITFLDKYNPDQFEIKGLSRYLDDYSGMTPEFIKVYFEQGNTGSIKAGHPDLSYYTKDGKAIVPYRRILIKRKK